MSDPRPIRDTAVDLVHRLQKAGHVAYFVGGCVRDQLLGYEPAEYDIATDAVPERLKDLFPGSHLVGESFGVVLVHSGGHTFEIATFRSEGGYADHRHPDEVTFCDAAGDVRRRDFTINGIFHDPVTGEDLDPYDGRGDLQRGVLRAIGEPGDRFNEDHLRMLRAIRFAARFGFAIDPDTAAAIGKHAGELQGVSRERVGVEIRRMAAEGDWARAVKLMAELGLEASVLGRASATEQWPRCEHLEQHCPRELQRHQAAIAAWLLDRIGTGTGPDASMLEDVGDRLVSSNQDRARLRNIIEVHGRLQDSWEGGTVAIQKRLAVRDGFSWAVCLLAATCPDDAARITGRVDELARTGLQPTPLVGGDDLIAAGMVPGPGFSRMLDAIYDAQLEGRITTAQEAVDLARSIGP